MLEASQDICKLFNADRLTLYAVNEDRTSIVSKVKTGLNTSRDLKLPVSAQSIAGYVAMSHQMVNIADVYDEDALKKIHPALSFLQEVDKRSGYRTKQMLVAPVMLEFPFAYAYFLVPAMFLLGTLEGEMSAQPMADVGIRFCAVFVTLFAVVCCWTGYEYFRAEEDFRMARFENLRIGKTPSDYERPKLVLLTQLGALRDSIRIRPEPGMTPEDIEIVRRVALHYPSGAPLSRYALVLALNGNPEEAIRQAQVLRVLLGEGAYMRLKLRFAEVGENTYPQLLEVKLP